MPPKFDPNAEIIVYVRVVGGVPLNSSALSPKVGPLGLNAKKIGDDITKNTKDWKGIKVTCKLVVKNRAAKVEIVPAASSLVMKALGEEPRDRKKTKFVKHNGNIDFDEFIKMARTMRSGSLSKTLTGVVLEILGTAKSIGCTVDHKDPCVVQQEIKLGAREVPSK